MSFFKIFWIELFLSREKEEGIMRIFFFFDGRRGKIGEANLSKNN